MKLAIIGLRGVPNVIGGIESHCELLYPVVKNQAPEIDLHLYARKGYVPATLRDYKGIRIHQFPAPKMQGAEALVHSFICILHARFRLRAQVIHLHGIGPGLLAPMVRLLGTRVVVTHHAPDFERPKWRRYGRSLLRFGETLTARFANAVICVSASVEEAFLSRHPEAQAKTIIIPNSARSFEEDPQATAEILDELGLSPGGFVMAAGRLEQTKRFEDLIEAKKRSPDARPLVIVGAAADKDPYEARIKAMAGPGIIMAGYRTGAHLAALYRNCALFIHPSAMEGFGLVVLEALAFHARAFLSDIPPHREFCLPDANYFPVGDVGAIAEMMAKADLSGLDEIDHRQVIARFDVNEAARAHIRLYHSLTRL